MNSVLDQYLDKIEPQKHELIRMLHNLVRKADKELIPSLKWGNLTYHHKKNVCAIIVHSKHINLQLWRGAELNDPRRRLRGSGKKMRHITISTVEDIEENYLKELLRQASAINR